MHGRKTQCEKIQQNSGVLSETLIQITVLRCGKRLARQTPMTLVFLNFG